MKDGACDRGGGGSASVTVSTSTFMCAMLKTRIFVKMRRNQRLISHATRTNDALPTPRPYAHTSLVVVGGSPGLKGGQGEAVITFDVVMVKRSLEPPAEPPIRSYGGFQGITTR